MTTTFFLVVQCFAFDDPVLFFSSLLIIFALVDKQYQFRTHANVCLLLETIRSDDKSCSFCEGLQVARSFPIVLVQFVTWPWPWMPTVLKRIKCNFLCCEKCENVRNRTSADAQTVFYLRRALGSCCTHSTQIDATLATFEANTRIIAHCMGVKVGFIVRLKHPVHIFLLYFAIFLHKYASVATVHNESVLTLK